MRTLADTTQTNAEHIQKTAHVGSFLYVTRPSPNGEGLVGSNPNQPKSAIPKCATPSVAHFCYIVGWSKDFF